MRPLFLVTIANPCGTSLRFLRILYREAALCGALAFATTKLEQVTPEVSARLEFVVVAFFARRHPFRNLRSFPNRMFQLRLR